MAYSDTADYDASDFDDIVMDGLGTAGVQVIQFISLIVIMVLAVWGKKKLNI